MEAIDLTYITTIEGLMKFREYCIERNNGDHQGKIIISDKLEMEIRKNQIIEINGIKTFCDWEIVEDKKTLWDKMSTYCRDEKQVILEKDFKEALNELYEFLGYDITIPVAKVKGKIKEIFGKELIE